MIDYYILPLYLGGLQSKIIYQEAQLSHEDAPVAEYEVQRVKVDRRHRSRWRCIFCQRLHEPSCSCLSHFLIWDNKEWPPYLDHHTKSAVCFLGQQHFEAWVKDLFK